MKHLLALFLAFVCTQPVFASTYIIDIEVKLVEAKISNVVGGVLALSDDPVGLQELIDAGICADDVNHPNEVYCNDAFSLTDNLGLFANYLATSAWKQTLSATVRLDEAFVVESGPITFAEIFARDIFPQCSGSTVLCAAWAVGKVPGDGQIFFDSLNMSTYFAGGDNAVWMDNDTLTFAGSSSFFGDECVNYSIVIWCSSFGNFDARYAVSRIAILPPTSIPLPSGVIGFVSGLLMLGAARRLTQHQGD